MSDQETERYVAISLEVLAAIKELDWLRRVDWHTLPSLRVILRVVRLEPTTGNIIIGAQVVRDLSDQQ